MPPQSVNLNLIKHLLHLFEYQFHTAHTLPKWFRSCKSAIFYLFATFFKYHKFPVSDNTTWGCQGRVRLIKVAPAKMLFKRDMAEEEIRLLQAAWWRDKFCCKRGECRSVFSKDISPVSENGYNVAPCVDQILATSDTESYYHSLRKSSAMEHKV